MDTATRRFTRSLSKGESPGKAANTASCLRKNVIYLDTPTPTKVSKTDQSIGTQHRMGSCAGKESPGNPFLKERKFSPTIVLSSGSKKNKGSHGFEPKEWEYCIQSNDRLGSRIMVSAPHDVILNLNAKMNEAQKGLFGISCFGNFLDLNEIHLQHQLIHKMLLMEVKQQKPDEMWFNVSGKLLRFSLQEFCLVTGLKGVGCEDPSKLRKGRSFLREKYFSHLKNIYQKDVEDVFKGMPANSKDEDVVKVGY